MGIVIKEGSRGERWVTVAERERPGLAESIWVNLDANGSLNFHGQDLGDDIKPIWGDDEYEYGIIVPSAEIGRLVLLLLKEKYDGDIGAVDKFQKFCKDNKIANEFWSWT
jgi:hypothetical protein